MPTVFRQPVLYAQTRLIQQALQAAKHEQELEVAALLDELDGLSDEEAARLLAEGQNSVDPVNRIDDLPSDSAKQK